ncbi:MAG: hypothetical protein PSX81_12150 [bacterium]|nr:hypothetical protein [bacterium]
MKKLSLIILLLFIQNAKAQDSTVFALLGNLAQLPYQCFELDGVLSTPDKKYQLLAGVHLTDGYTNAQQARNVKPFEAAFMKKASDKIQGLGFGGQIRMNLSNNPNSRWKMYAALGANRYNYNLKFYENAYVYDQPPFYHYTVAVHKEKFTRVALDAQLIFNYSPGVLFFETGLGLAYNQSNIPKAIEDYRTYHTSNMDYGFTGLSPIFSIRMGAWLF